MKDKLNSIDSIGAAIGRTAGVQEELKAEGVYRFELRRVLPSFKAQAEYLARSIKRGRNAAWWKFWAKWDIAKLEQKLINLPRYTVFDELVPNTVTTPGKNDLLDKYLAGSAYTAAFFLGLISLTSFSAISAADTMASHAGWLEAGLANTPTYSNATRISAAWSSASAGSKALSAALGFLITGTGTVKGGFLTTVSTKDGTTGILFSAGLFTGGDKAVANTDTLNVSYSLAV